VFLPTLPKGPTRGIDRGALRDRALAIPAGFDFVATVIDSAAASAFGLLGSSTITTPDLLPGVRTTTSGDISKRLNGYLNLAAFAPAPVIRPDGSTGFGTLGRNTFRGPVQQNWDISVAKSFAISETPAFRITTDFFNSFNHANFASPAFVDIQNPSNFGQITNTIGTPRLIQFSARYSF
jgi:hypothetical protein